MPATADAPRPATAAAPASRPTTTPAAPPFETDIRAFEAADKLNPPPPGAVVFVGSSSIRLWKTLAADFADLPPRSAPAPPIRDPQSEIRNSSPTPVLNRGFGGSQVADSVRYADRIVLPYRPSAVVLYAGDNDLASGKSPQQVSSDFRAFVEKIHARQPATPILYLAIKPSLARRHLLEQVKEANRMVQQFAAENDHVEYVDVFTPMLTPEGEPRGDLLVADRLHLNDAGYRLWKSILRPQLERALADR